MNLAVVLVHNKGDLENAAQIEALKPLIEKQTEIHDELDQDGNVIGQFETYYYTLIGLPDHQVKFYQIIPFGVTSPPNKDDIDSYKVFYGKGDEDKTGDHPRFYNWGLKRAAGYGADVVLHLDDHTKFDLDDLEKEIRKSEKKIDRQYGKISKKDAPQIKEN